MSQHDTLAWMTACGPYVSGICIAVSNIAAALLARSRRVS
jgi:hypothetical protein